MTICDGPWILDTIETLTKARLELLNKRKSQ
jgi:hypothetical protein